MYSSRTAYLPHILTLEACLFTLTSCQFQLSIENFQWLSNLTTANMDLEIFFQLRTFFLHVEKHKIKYSLTTVNFDYMMSRVSPHLILYLLPYFSPATVPFDPSMCGNTIDLHTVFSLIPNGFHCLPTPFQFYGLVYYNIITPLNLKLKNCIRAMF